jgi:hypothetical protein
LIAGLWLACFYFWTEPDDPERDLPRPAKKIYPGDLGRLQGDWEILALGTTTNIQSDRRVRITGNKVQGLSKLELEKFTFTLTLNKNRLTLTVPSADERRFFMSFPQPRDSLSGTYLLRSNVLIVRIEEVQIPTAPREFAVVLTRPPQLIVGRADPNDPSILYTEAFKTGEGSTIENGMAFDQASVDLKGAKSVTLPEKAHVVRADDVSGLRIFMRKTMEFYGRSGESLSIRHTRTFMGCAAERKKEELRLATFGEGLSTDGGGWMSLVVHAPTTIDIRQSPGFQGIDSPTRSWKPDKPLRKTPGAGKWYGQEYFASGWEVVPDKPDPKRIVEKKGF